MLYKNLGNTGMKVSEVGLGCEYLEGMEAEKVHAIIDAALAAGINILDVFMSEPNVRTHIGAALKGRREKVYIQGHFRAVWKGGQYGRTLDLQETKDAFEDLLTRLDTTYMDIGMVHMVDNDSDYEAVFEGEIYQYVRSCKEAGRIRSIGLSTHNVDIALRAVEKGLVDVLLFSLNPAYDMLHDGAEGPTWLTPDLFTQRSVEGMDPKRSRLYQLCEAKGVGITVMKGLAAGTLLKDETSPFGVAMTVPQCIHYCLTRPAVASVLVGMQSPEEVTAAVAYETLTDAERDYTHILSQKPQFSLKGHCMYCNHCLPCPAQIDIAQVNKYRDLAKSEGAPSPTIKAHYESLAHTGGDCIRCGACESRCPFGVPVMERMAEAATIFGK